MIVIAGEGVNMGGKCEGVNVRGKGKAWMCESYRLAVNCESGGRKSDVAIHLTLFEDMAVRDNLIKRVLSC